MRSSPKQEQSKSETQTQANGPSQLVGVAAGIAALMAAVCLFGYAAYYLITKSTYCYFDILVWHHSIMARHVISNAVFGGLCSLFQGIDDKFKPAIGTAGLVAFGLISLFIAKRMFGRLGGYSPSEKEEFANAERLEENRE